MDRPSRHICSGCLMRLPFVEQRGCCRVCGRSAPEFEGEYLCGDCAEAPRPGFDRAGSALRFEGAGREAVLAWKFRSAFELKEDLTDFLEATAMARFGTEGIDAVVPMPVTWLRRLERGYNQCGYLAAGLARRLNRLCLDGVLRRRGMPRRQSELGEEFRRENVKGTFRVADRASVRGRTLLLVDDIMTTGATLSEAARELKAAGAWRVWAVTLARSVRY